MKKKKDAQLRLEVKQYYSPDITSIQQWIPADDAVYYHLEMEIGLQDEDRADRYFVIIANSAGIGEARQRQGSSIPTAARILVLDPYSWKQTITRIESILESIQVYDRQDPLDELLHYFNWEYENNHTSYFL